MPSACDESFLITEEPDLAIGHYIGHVNADDVRRVTALRVRFCEGKPHVFMILDVHRMVHISSEARRVAAELSGAPGDTARIHGIAIVGASFHIRVIGGMLFRAIHLLRRTSAFPVQFMDTHAEARAWFDDRRSELGLPR